MAGEVKFKLAIEGGKVVGAELDGVTSRLGGMEKAASATGNMLSGMQAKVLALSGTFATLLSVQKAVMAADAVTTLKNQLDLATGSAQRAAQAYEELFAIAQRSRVSFTELGATFASISRAGQELGISQERLLTVTQAIGQAMTISGGSSQSLQAALIQLSQGLSSGTLRGEELNSVMEQAPRLAKALADGMNVPIGKLREMGAAGEITAQQVIAALEKSAPQLAREVEGATLTVGQAFTVLQNDVVKFVGDADNATGASAALAQAMVSLSGGVRSLGGFIREHETAFAVIGGTLAGAAVAAGIYATGAAVLALAGNIGVLSAALMANPILLTLGGIAAGVGALMAAQKAYANSAQGMATEVASLTQRIQAAEATLAKTQGGDKLTEQMRARVEAMKARKKELQGILAVQVGEGLDTRAEDARLAQHTQQIKAQTQAEADLAKLRQKLSGVPESYVKDMEEVIRLNQAGVLVGKDYTDMLGQMQAKLVKKTGTLSDAAKGLNLYNDLTAQGNGLNADFAEKWALLTAAYKGGTLTLAQLTDAQGKLLAKQPAVKAETDAQTQATKDLAKAQEDARKQLAQYYTGLEKDLATLEESNKKLREHVEEIGLETDALNALRLARLDATIAQEEEILTMASAHSTSQEEILLMQRRIDLLKEQRSLTAQGQDKEVTAAAAKAAFDEWKKTAEKIQDSITDALMRGFESGKGFAENLRDTVVNMFKTMVLRPVVEMGVRGGLSMLGMGGASGAASAASAADVLGTVGAAGNAASGLSMLGGLSGWLTDFGGSVTSTVNNVGRSIADLSEISGSYGSTVDSIGTSIQGSAAAVGQFATYAGYAAAAVGVFDAASKGQWGRAIGTGVGAIWGPIGSAIGSAVGGWVDEAFGGGHEYTTGTGISGKFSGNSFAGRNYQDWRNDGSSGFLGIGGSGSSSGTNYSAMDTALQKSLGSAFAGIKTQTAAFALALGLSATSIQAFSKDIKLSLGSDAAANQQAIASMMQGIANDAAATVLDAQYIRQGEAAADTLARLATNLTLVNGSFDTLDKILLTTSQAGGDTASQLVDALGGLQQYQSGMAAYYQAYYSEEERQAKTREQTRKALADLGFAMPTTLQGYRDLVTAQEVSTEAGRKTFAALINLSTAFASVTTEVDGLQTAFVNTAKGIKTLVDSIASVRSGVASDRQSLGPQTVMGMDSIRAAVAAISASAPAPSTAAMDAARLAASSADAALTAAQATAEAKAAALATATIDNAALAAKYKAAGTTAQNLATGYGLSINSSKAPHVFANDAYSYDPKTNQVNDFNNFGYRTWTNSLITKVAGVVVGSATTSYDTSVNIKSLQNALRGNSPGYVYQSGSGTFEAGSLIDILSGANTKLAAQSKKIADAQAASIAAQTALATATSNKATADAAATATALAYSQAVDAWTVEASKSVPALDKLREQTLKYYESQKALAELMGTSAANLRVAVQTARTGQLDSTQSLAQQQSTFATAYSLALSTSGAVQAGYADKLTATLPELSAALMDTATSRADWAQATAKLFAQSESVAKLLEANAPVNYQADSLAMLDSIDATLAVLDDSTRSITRAIESSGGLTAAGLREVVQALGGTPGFAAGGYHSGGARWVGENGPELEVTGPSHIFNMGQLRRLGNAQQGSDMEAVVAELRALRQDNANMRAELRAIAVSSNKMAKVLERVTPDGSSVQMVVAA